MSEDTSEIAQKINELASEYKLRIAELEAENTELRETLEHAHKLLVALGAFDGVEGARRVPELTEVRPI